MSGPRSGLEQADVVYEEVTEGGITRFAAIFQSQVPAEVGPIRSVRSIDPDLVTPIGGIFAYSGGAQPNVEKIQQAPVNSVDESQAGDAMFRVDSQGRAAQPFGRGQALFDKGGQPVPPPALFEYRDEERDVRRRAGGGVHGRVHRDPRLCADLQLRRRHAHVEARHRRACRSRRRAARRSRPRT